MAFRILENESVEEATRRVAREQIDKAIGELEDRELDPHETVHQVRKRCKKIRGLIRLVRPQFEASYQRENDWYRDSARSLSYVRDAQSLVETFDALMERFSEPIDSRAFSSIRRKLIDHRRNVSADEDGLRERLDDFLDRMYEGRDRVAGWRLKRDGFRALNGGMQQTYRRGRSAMRTAYKKPLAEHYHEWRKRAKYHGYHVRLLRQVWRKPLEARRGELERLSDHLGNDHDLAILRQTLLELIHQVKEASIQSIVGMINQRQVELRLRAMTLGARVFAEKPKRFASRLRAYWDAWREEQNTTPRTTHEPELVTM